MKGPGLTAVSLPDLQALLQALESGRLTAPITATALSAAGFGGRSVELARVFEGLATEGVRRLVEVAVAERTHRVDPRLELVWSGPEARNATARDTAVVVRQMFAEAERSVVVGGFRFDHGRDILRPLHEGMVARGVKAAFFMDIEGQAASVAAAEAYATEQIDAFFRDNWPFGPPHPDVYYDPRTAVKGPPWASLHAKCVVTDDRRAFITSANFTERGQERNIEAGVLIDDPGFAVKLASQWRGLVSSGQVRRYEG
jgi:phosphatidylserine/phosphatidylglycerophosphate/cardiolipin synthase-like enzyme